MKKKYVVPTHESVSNSGDGLVACGWIFAGICVALGLLAMFGSSAAPVAFLGAPFGVLLIIAGYAKKTSAASVASYISLTQESGRATERQVSSEQ